MSTFRVAIEEIASVASHPNADRLDTATLCGMTFQFVVAKGKFEVGDRVVYFPLDAMIPEPVLGVLGLVGKLGGEGRNIVRTATLRGFLSQGLVEFPRAFVDAGLLHGEYYDGDFAEALGVFKHRPPDISVPGATLFALPSCVTVYDIQGADRYAGQFDALMDQDVLVMEKLEGCNFGDHLEAGEFSVLQRENSVVEREGFENPICEVARREKHRDMLDKLADIFPNEIITLTGEYIGPKAQGNHYELARPTVLFFDIRLSGRFLDAGSLEEIAARAGIPLAPILFKGKLRDWLAGRTITQAAHGRSALNASVLREGVVIKPLKEQRDGQIGRIILKQRDPVYLAKTGRG